jgi:sulfate adenylyltransferase
MLSENQKVPDNFSRPEVLIVLRKYYASLKDSEKIKVKLKGHSAK